MRKLILGLLAHVDAGKTTLSEALLYCCGAVRTKGRVDHGDAFLDTDVQEKERGITIFSKQASCTWHDLNITLMDTPGHVDFSSEMERTLQVLDAAVLVISGADGVQSHTETLWRLLDQYRIPVFLFINKMDQPGTDKSKLLSQLQMKLSSGCTDLAADDFEEQAASRSESTIEKYLAGERLSDADIRQLIGERQLFPCVFGSALKSEGIDALLDALSRFAPIPAYPDIFSARVFKIARDSAGTRLTYMKITGGSLAVRAALPNPMPSENAPAEEKINQIRLYSGAKYKAVERVEAGTVCAVTGLTFTRAGMGLGAEAGLFSPLLTPVFTYQALLTPSEDPVHVLPVFRQLEEEDPQLHVVWNSRLKEIHVQLMGEIQLEILQRLLKDRFGLTVSFSEGGILYRETIDSVVEGVGHYEPLRHYAEVHLLLEPGDRGSGLRFSTVCSEDDLDRNWQRLILTHLMEKTHLGVLTGSPITDMKITLLAGRAHLKHTEGGDFRQATYRAVRQGLMQAKSVLLEPWYDMRFELPADCLGRALHDIQQMGGAFSPPEANGDTVILTAAAPVAAARHYARDVAAYTHGKGRLQYALKGYEPCREQEAVVAGIGYDPERDVENSADSIFCSHGAGFPVKWDQVKGYMHIDTGFGARRASPAAAAPSSPRSGPYRGTLEEDKELMAIFERTYGPVKPRAFMPPPRTVAQSSVAEIEPPGEEYLLVDGYNIIFAWDELKKAAKENLELARQALMDTLCNYQGFRKCHVILVFDAYKVPGGVGACEVYNNITVIYTKEAQTADSYIEKAAYDLSRKHRVRVVTSDGMEQLIILGSGALRVSSAEFQKELKAADIEIAALLDAMNRSDPSPAVRNAVRDAWEKKKQEIEKNNKK